MALVDCGRLLWPDPDRYLAFTAFSGDARYQINGAGQRVGWVFTAPRAGTVTRVGVRVNAAASPVLSRLGLYTVGSDGNPTATAYGGSVHGTFTPAAATYVEVTLGTAATMTPGPVALVAEFDSAAGDFSVSHSIAGLLSGPGYTTKFNGTSWAKNASSSAVAAHLFYSDLADGYQDIGGAPFTAAQAAGAYNLNTAGADEYALRLTVPFACRVAGIWHNFATAAGADYEAILYDGTTAIRTLAVDGDVAASTSQVGRRSILFADGPIVSAGTVLRAAIRPTTTANVTWRRYPLFAAGAAAALGLPADACESTRVDQGAWSDTDTNLPSIGLIIDRIDDGRVSPRTRPLRSVSS